MLPLRNIFEKATKITKSLLDLKSAASTASGLAKGIEALSERINSQVRPSESIVEEFKKLSSVGDCQQMLKDSPSLSDQDKTNCQNLDEAMSKFTAIVPESSKSFPDFVSFLNAQFLVQSGDARTMELKASTSSLASELAAPFYSGLGLAMWTVHVPYRLLYRTGPIFLFGDERRLCNC